MSSEATERDERPDILTWLELLHPNQLPGGRKTLVPSSKDYDAMVEEAALGYFTEQELARRFKCGLEVLRRITEHPQFEADVLAKRRELDQTDLGVRTIARRKVRGAIKDMMRVIEDAESQTARVKAF
jgi:hypothetical protein